MSNLLTLASAVATAPDLFSSQCKMKEKYPALNTRKRIVNNWWDSLEYDGKLDVGSAAFHFGKITANTRWDCHSKFENLSTKQKNIVKFVFLKRKNNWSMFYLPALLKF